MRPERIRSIAYHYAKGKAVYPTVRPYREAWEAPDEARDPQPGDLFVTPDLNEVSVCLPGSGRTTIMRRTGLVGQPDAVRHEDGTVSVGEFTVKTVLSSQVAEHFRIERDVFVYLG